jgi:HPt (histidine-containing phosphotransfer) domain-containing protein
MLIYNHKKEFLGIDESDLKTLGLSSLADLRAEVADFADFFVKSPGYIHNFKHVHWIDYITCNDSGVDSKAIINVKGKSYSTTIDIRTIYLVDSPAQKAYVIELPNIKALSQAQNEKIAISAAQKQDEPVTPPKAAPKSEATHERLNTNIIKDIYEEDIHEFAFDVGKPLDIEVKEEKREVVTEPVVEKEKSVEPVKKPAAPKVEHTEEDSFANYIFDPQVASEDLGLPIDLVEEFVQDFIAQANSFKNDLYESAKTGSSDNLKIQSHKLKGVAANLRIEDALDALTIINSSSNDDEIIANLDRLYRIINKLDNKENTVVKAEVTTEKPKEVEEDFVLSFKDDNISHAKKTDKPKDLSTIEIDDSQVPDSIDMPELADDEFLKQKPIAEIDEDIMIDEDLPLLNEPNNVVQDKIKEEIQETVLHYDKKKIAHDIGLDIDSFNELFEDYLGETKELSNSMSSSIEKNDLYACKNAAIKLKGMSENMRIHDFDTSLEAIINSADVDSAKTFVKSVLSKLDLISKTEGK